MKINKNKKKLTIILGASALALTTVGFASWVIAGNAAIDSQNVDVTFGEVSDSRVVATLTSSDLVLKFDAQQDAAGPVTGTTTNEDLIFSFDYTIQVGSSMKLTGVKFDISNDPFTTLDTEGFVVKPYATTQTLTLSGNPTATDTYVSNKPFTTYTKGTASGQAQIHTVKYDTATSTYTFKSTFTFKWGAMFNNTNPSKADNVSGGTHNADAIVKNLNAFKTKYGTTTGQKIGVTISPVTTAA